MGFHALLMLHLLMMNYAVIVKIMEQKVPGRQIRLLVVIVLKQNTGDGTVIVTTNCFVNTSIEVKLLSSTKLLTLNIFFYFGR